jgi:SPP1 family predicted phage head-tail adaptor
MPNKSVSVNGRAISIADMRTRVTFQVATRASDNQGGSTETWANLSTAPVVWGYLAAVSSRERLYAQQIQYQRSHILVIRYRSDITTDMRFTYNNRTFQVKGIRNPEERKYFSIIDVEENQGS